MAFLISFQHTHSTRVRLAILSAFGDVYIRDNKDAKCRLIAHESRPSLTLIPPPSTEKRPVTYRFIEAVQRLVPNFSKKVWSDLYSKVGTRLHLGQLKKVFIILNDEDRLLPGRDSAQLSGANAVPVAGRGRGVGRGRLATRGGRSGSDEHQHNKRGLEDPSSATPAKTRRGK